MSADALASVATRSDQTVVSMTPKLVTSIVYVDPTTAARWLASNSGNRSLRTRSVNQYARDMAEGRWTVDPAAICFDTSGALMNGQHRLHAVVQAGVTLPFTVLRNVPRDAMMNMDTGAKRTTSDYLGLTGESNTKILASTLRFLVQIDTGRIYKDTAQAGVSTSELNQFLAAHPEARRWAAAGHSARVSIGGSPTAIAVAMFLIAEKAGDDRATEFFDALVTRVGLSHGDAVLALDSRLRNLRAHKATPSNRDLIHLFLKTWNHRQAGRQVSSLTMPKSGARLPEVSA